MLENDPKLTELQNDIADLYNRILYVQCHFAGENQPLVCESKPASFCWWLMIVVGRFVAAECLALQLQKLTDESFNWPGPGLRVWLVWDSSSLLVLTPRYCLPERLREFDTFDRGPEAILWVALGVRAKPSSK